jgi:phage shock protein PspC (stress-responsive transcriptional regulator)
MTERQRKDLIMASLVRPRRDKVIAGVCAGIARRYGWSPNAVRLAFVLSCLLPGPQVLLYIALWIFIPKES